MSSRDTMFGSDFMKGMVRRVLLLSVFGYILYMVVLKSFHVFCRETMEIHFYFHFNFIIFSILLCEANRKILMNRASMKECAKDGCEIKAIVMEKAEKEFRNAGHIQYYDWFDSLKEASDIQQAINTKDANNIILDEDVKRNILHTSANTILEISFHESLKNFPKKDNKTDLVYEQFSSSSQQKFDSLCKLFSDYAADSVFVDKFHDETPTFEDTDGKIWRAALPLGKDLLKERENSDYLKEHLPAELEDIIVFLYSKAAQTSRDILIFHSELVIETAAVLLNNNVKGDEMLVGYFSIPEKEQISFEEYSVVRRDPSNLGSDRISSEILPSTEKEESTSSCEEC